MCSVYLKDSEKVVSISSEHLEPVTPTKSNKVWSSTSPPVLPLPVLGSASPSRRADRPSRLSQPSQSPSVSLDPTTRCRGLWAPVAFPGLPARYPPAPLGPHCPRR